MRIKIDTLKRRISVIFLSIVFFIALSQSTYAAIERTCKAKYRVDVLAFIDEPSESLKGFDFGQFSATRGCGSLSPNQCRRRARDAAQACMDDAWAEKDFPNTPDSCKSNGVKGYGIGKLSPLLQDRTCNFMVEKGVYESQIALYAVTEGDIGCGAGDNKRLDTKLTASYFISCNQPTPQ